MKKILLIFLFLFLLTPIYVLAQTEPCNPEIELCNYSGVGDVPTTVGNVLRTVLGLVGVIALLMFIYAGFIWMTAQGSGEKIKKATTIIVWTSIALLILFSSYTILRFVFDLDFIPK